MTDEFAQQARAMGADEHFDFGPADEEEDDDSDNTDDTEQGFQESQEEVKVDSTSYRMERDDNIKFDKVETTELKDLSHLFRTKGNQVYMITEEEYAKEQEEKKRKRREKRKAKKEVKEKLRKEHEADRASIEQAPS